MRKLTIAAIRKAEAELWKQGDKHLSSLLRMLMKAQADVEDEKRARKQARRTYSHYM